MTVRLRAHHILCLLTYVGKGYSADFIVNFNSIVARIMDGEGILIVEGPDDICAPLLSEGQPHCLGERVLDRDRQAAFDIGRILNISIQRGTQIDLQGPLLERMRTAFFDGRTRTACLGCEWSDMCSSIAIGGYSETRLRKRNPQNEVHLENRRG